MTAEQILALLSLFARLSQTITSLESQIAELKRAAGPQDPTGPTGIVTP